MLIETHPVIAGLPTGVAARLMWSLRLSRYPWTQASQGSDVLSSPVEKPRAPPLTSAPGEFHLFQKVQLSGKACWRSRSVS